MSFTELPGPIDESLTEGEAGGLLWHERVAQLYNRWRSIPPPALSGRLTADTAGITATALANVTGLSFTVASGVVYRFDFAIVYRSAALTTGIRLGLTTPAFSNFAANVRIAGFAADGTDSVFEGPLTTSGDSVMSTATVAITTDHPAWIRGIIIPSAAGTVQLQAATEVASSAITLRTGSNFTATAL
jgi:hypothetical protein